MYLNWKRKSVVGYSFDLLALNLLGFVWCAPNSALSWPNVSISFYFYKGSSKRTTLTVSNSHSNCYVSAVPTHFYLIELRAASA